MVAAAVVPAVVVASMAVAVAAVLALAVVVAMAVAGTAVVAQEQRRAKVIVKDENKRKQKRQEMTQLKYKTSRTHQNVFQRTVGTTLPQGEADSIKQHHFIPRVPLLPFPPSLPLLLHPICVSRPHLPGVKHFPKATAYSIQNNIAQIDRSPAARPKSVIFAVGAVPGPPENRRIFSAFTSLCTYW